METCEKTTCSKRFSRQLPIFLLLASLGGRPVDGQEKPAGGTNDANTRASAVVRDPFWPVGYKPEPVLESGAQNALKGKIDWNEAMKQVVINGISSRAGGGYVAIINNEVRSVGETFSIRYGGLLYTWKVDRVAPPGSVKLRRVLAE